MRTDYTKLTLHDATFWNTGLTDAQAAEYLGVTVKHLQHLRQTRQGPTVVRTGSRGVRYRRIDLLEWQESRADDGQAKRATVAP